MALVPVDSWGFGTVFSHFPVLPGSGGSTGLPIIRGQPFDPSRMFKLPELPEPTGLGSILLPPDDDQEVEEYSREEKSPSVTILIRDSESVWEQKRSEDRERLEAFKEEEVPVRELDLDLEERHDDPLLSEVGGKSKSYDLGQGDWLDDSDSFREQQAALAQQARKFQEKQQQADRIKAPFESRDENPDFNQETLGAHASTDLNTEFKPDTNSVWQGELDGMVFLPGNKPDAEGGSGESGQTGGNTDPSAPPPQGGMSEPPPDYDSVVQGQGYVSPPALARPTIVVRNGILVHEPSIPVAVDLQQVMAVNPELAQQRDFLQRMPPSIGQLQNLGTNQGAVIEATRKLEIPIGLTNKFSKLQEYHLDLIIDNSGSMNESDTGLSTTPGGYNQLTRMEELKCRLKSMVPLLAAVSTQGITVRCLNVYEPQCIPGEMPIAEKECALNSIIESLQPWGGTPLNKAVRDSFESARRKRQQTVAYIFTDGEPSDYGEGASGAKGFIKSVQKIRRQEPADFYPIGMMACTDKKSCIKWMNWLDNHRELGRIQVMDDYFSERKEVYDQHGGVIPYTLGLYMAASLLGPVDQMLDNLDESEIFRKHEVEELMGFRISQEEYRRYYQGAVEARSNRKTWGRGQHPVEELNREPLELMGQRLYRVIDGFTISDTDSDDDFAMDVDDPPMPNVEQCPCVIL
ncbi:MAG: hypothetical protein ACR2PX_00800 [Endozoicomonas sp.]|uniref:hypothetical protein n=1 Tax=Endozoicomonas sp. TaxID=1892382 RepID=UPI003D9B2B8B